MRKRWSLQERAFDRRVRHTAYVSRPFEAICEDLERSGTGILVNATKNARSRADHLVIDLDQDLPFFHIDETVTIAASELERQGPEFACMKLRWHADRRKRLLPNFAAELQIHAVIQSGPSATTAVSVVGDFEPPNNLIRRLDEALFTRRLVEAVALSFVNTVADLLRASRDGQEAGR